MKISITLSEHLMLKINFHFNVRVNWDSIVVWRDHEINSHNSFFTTIKNSINMTNIIIKGLCCKISTSANASRACSSTSANGLALVLTSFLSLFLRGQPYSCIFHESSISLKLARNVNLIILIMNTNHLSFIKKI